MSRPKGATISIRTSVKCVKLIMKFDPDEHTIYDVKKAFCDQESPSYKPEQMVLYKVKKELQFNGKKLKDYSITRVAVLSLTVRLDGGSLWLPDTYNELLIGKRNRKKTKLNLGGFALYKRNNSILNNKRNRTLDTTDPDIKSSDKPDCIMFNTDTPRAEMPCGHAFCPQTMFDLAKSVITKNEYEFEIKCPMPQCGIEFDFDLVAKVADMNEAEELYFAEEIAKRSMPETKKCPNSKCDADCERPESLKKFRVKCQACSGVDWCWLCNGKWLGGGFTVCGNQDCPSRHTYEMLLTCDIKKTTYKDVNGKFVEVPRIRACPKCLEFIEHSDLCKHMKCRACGHEFCFSCLKAKDSNGKWPCGDHKYQCPVAPKQKLN